MRLAVGAENAANLSYFSKRVQMKVTLVFRIRFVQSKERIRIENQ